MPRLHLFPFRRGRCFSPAVRFVLIVAVLILSASELSFAAPGSEKWAYDIGSTESYAACPAVDDDGTIYIGSSDTYMYALNSDGSLKWRSQLEGKAGKRSVVIGSDGTLYLGTDDPLGAGTGYFYAVNRADGSKKWSAPFVPGEEVTSSAAQGADGTLYFGCRDDYLYAVNQDGTLKWKFKTGGDIFSSPIIGEDGTIYFGSSDKKLYALNPDGTEKWSYTATGEIETSPAMGSDGTLYVGTLDNFALAVKSDGTLKWKYNVGGLVYSAPAIGTDGTVYLGSGDKNLYALKPDGTFKWTYTTDAAIQESAPAVGGDGTVYVSSTDGYLYAVKSGGSLKWKADAGAGSANQVQGPPAIAPDGTVYVVSRDRNLYAFEGDSGGLADSPWPKFLKNPKNTGSKQAISLGASPSQAAGVSVTMSSIKAKSETAAQLRTEFKGLGGFTPCNDVLAFNASVTEEANATFYMESDQLNGTVSEFWLYKLKNGETLPFDGYSPVHNNYTNGIWWITDVQDAVQNRSVILNKGTTYRIYFCIKDNGGFDLNATKGKVEDPVVLGRSVVAGSAVQPAGVLPRVANALRPDLENSIANDGWNTVGLTPLAAPACFNATITPANSSAVFRFNTTKLSGPVADLTLVKRFEFNNTFKEYGTYSTNTSDFTEGNWRLTYRNLTVIPQNATLTQGTNYFVNLVIRDNGMYDADPEPGSIKDPVAIGTGFSEPGSSSGCIMNPAAGFVPELLLLLVGGPLAALIRNRRKR